MRLTVVLVVVASAAALRLPAAQAVAFAPTRHALAPRHARTCMVDEVDEVDDVEEVAGGIFKFKRKPEGEETSALPTPEELEQARQEKEIRLARIAAVNAGQVTVGQSLPGKAFTVVLLIGVFGFLVGTVGDPQNCEFLPTTKDTCMARPATQPE